jgi:uncharacterized protein (TIGR03066 family)
MKLVVALVCMFAFVGYATRAEAKPDLKKAILGKWAPVEQKAAVLEFRADGTLELSVNLGSGAPIKVAGTYKWVDGETIEVKVTVGKETQTDRAKIAIDGDTMTTTDSKGKAEKLTRVK